MTLQKKYSNKIIAFLQVDHMIDLITNSSSELFLIENKVAKETIVELVNEALKGTGFSVSKDSVEERFFEDGSIHDQDWKIEQALETFPKHAREELKEKYFSNPKYYGVAFDRDKIYTSNNRGHDIRSLLINIGFELVDTDY